MVLGLGNGKVGAADLRGCGRLLYAEDVVKARGVHAVIVVVVVVVVVPAAAAAAKASARGKRKAAGKAARKTTLRGGGFFGCAARCVLAKRGGKNRGVLMAGLALVKRTGKPPGPPRPYIYDDAKKRIFGGPPPRPGPHAAGPRTTEAALLAPRPPRPGDLRGDPQAGPQRLRAPPSLRAEGDADLPAPRAAAGALPAARRLRKELPGDWRGRGVAAKGEGDAGEVDGPRGGVEVALGGDAVGFKDVVRGGPRAGHGLEIELRREERGRGKEEEG